MVQADLMSMGRLFQSRGTAAMKDRSPMVTLVRCFGVLRRIPLNTHLCTAGVVQDCHNSLISAFLISQLDLLPTRFHSRSFKLGVGVIRLAFLLIVGPFI